MDKHNELVPYGSEKPSDCDVIEADFIGVFEGVGNCFDTLFDEQKKKTGLIRDLFGLGASVTKLGWHLTGCAVKHAPKAAVAVAQVKREIVDAIGEEVHQYQKEKKEEELRELMRDLSKKR